MKEKIIAALKQRYSNLGLGDKVFEATATFLEAGTTDETLETAIAGVEPMLKAAQGEADSVRTRKSEVERKLAELEAKAKEAEKAQPVSTQPEDPISKVLSSLESLASKVNQIEQTTKAKTIESLLYEKINKDIPKEFYADRISGKVFNDEAEIESTVSKIESDFNIVAQHLANKKIGEMGSPGKGNNGANNKTASDVEIDQLAKAMGLK